MDPLKQSVQVNQFIMVTGSDREEATRLLTKCDWQFESALSIFFQDQILPRNENCTHGNYPLAPPANTPCTPPNFPDAIVALSKLVASDKNKH